ncbi:MAG: hypothetical protein A2W93_10135 [Bacteroidetes bacterium GWF2_43_63]|nr:MAG: hypothetical protein A2W94_02335 [Bacteroidetes bacterium GWE2_42_42]OFY52882.1 MAG: hypothetical protein A2W93_10135 [Bacteroidetes bacterium GWF2_43_63]HBG70087.1 hypothetical protein [Bacteroidales bacterium]HCB62306.1 hypothetical protein [Bacteroidales bacterium]
MPVVSLTKIKLTMKTSILILGLLSVLAFSSCSKDTPAVVQKNLESGEWKITYFYDKDHEETTDYAGYTFTFNDDGTIMATTSSGNVSGTWSTGVDDSQDRLYLTFSSPDKLIEISDDWVILEQSNSKIELEDDSDNSTELLTFEKI